MSQQIRVLQCTECNLYQVDIVKKSNNWECKVCRQKQKLLNEFFRGSGAECRQKVQELNMQHGQKSQALGNSKILKVQKQQDVRSQSTSKWANYVDELPPPSKKVKYMDELSSPTTNTDSKKPSDEESYSEADKLSHKRALTKKTPSKWQEFL